MKYKVGDKIRIKSIDWYNENKTIKYGDVDCGAMPFMNYMTEFCGKIVTISHIDSIDECYEIEEDGGENGWTDEMIEGIVEDENNDCKKCGLTRNSTRCLFMDNCPNNKQKNIIEIPEDWVLKDNNGNIINTTKIILEKKKKEYPKTYEECCVALEYIPHTDDINGYKWVILQSLQRLLICRDAYWKIAGDEMGLGKPWKPDYDSGVNKYGIICMNGVLHKSTPTTNWERHLNKVLDFPTEEMRDAFYENFKDLIELCKELL